MGIIKYGAFQQNKGLKRDEVAIKDRKSFLLSILLAHKWIKARARGRVS